MSSNTPEQVPLNGRRVIEASAGTGKTYAIGTLYLRLLQEEQLHVRQILVVTFTKAATAELRARLRARIRQAARLAHGRDKAHLLTQLRDFDQAAISTIHGFCQRALRDHAFDSGVPFELAFLEDELPLLDEVADDFWGSSFYETTPASVETAIDELSSKRRHDLIREALNPRDAQLLPGLAAVEAGLVAEKPPVSLDTMATYQAAVAYARREVPARKQERRLLSFDDLLYVLAKGLHGDPESSLARRLRRQFKAALIDEFQDTDPVQWTIFKTAFDHAGVPLLLVGDPKQSIYAFRGADVFAYLDARGDEPPLPLATNWRSDPGLIAALNRLYGRAPQAFLSAGIDYVPVEPRPRASNQLRGPHPAPLRLVWVGFDAGIQRKTFRGDRPDRILKNNDQVAKLAAYELRRLLDPSYTIAGKPITPGQIAVLCRTNAQARLMQERLRSLQVRSVLHGDASVFETTEAEELGRILAALASPADRWAIKAALATAAAGWCAADIAALAEDEAGWDALGSRFLAWHELWRERGFIRAIRAAFEGLGGPGNLLQLVDGERRMTNYLHLFELLNAASHCHRLGPNALVRWFSDAREGLGDHDTVAPDEAQIRLESDDAAVQLVTIHKSKGLEYDVVLCPFLFGKGPNLPKLARFHDDDGRVTLDIGSVDYQQNRQRAGAEQRAEAARVVYVALTRAKHLCIVHTGPFNELEKSALAPLLHPESNADTQLSAEALRAELEELANGSDGAIAVVDADRRHPRNYQAPDDGSAELQARVTRRSLNAGYRRSYFSALATQGDASARLVEARLEEGVRDDEPDEAPSSTSWDAGTRQHPRGDAPGALGMLPAGRRTGTMIHKVVEEADFQRPNDVRASVQRNLAHWGSDAALTEPLTAELNNAFEAPFDVGAPDSAPMRLHDLPPSERINEMRFLLSVDEQPWLTPKRLAEVFRQHGSPARDPGYADKLAALRFTPLAGQLSGEIDLVFRHQGRYHLVDYKTNRLGPTLAHYGPAALARAMSHGHYYLQYHLYAVALHRYLQRRLLHYRYAEHMGGVHYLYLRGMTADGPLGYGVFQDRPPEALIVALSALIGEVCP